VPHRAAAAQFHEPFFEAFAFTPQDVPHRDSVNLLATGGKPRGQAVQGHVARFDLPQNPVPMGSRNLRLHMAANLARGNAASPGKALKPLDHARNTHTETRGNHMAALASFDKTHRPHTQLHRIWLGHRRWPPTQWPV
jgi:hypothetical protein